jgi:succinate dehydrogenase / fumarate reductase membrane anchor subunit
MTVSMRTPLGRVQGLGSAKAGVHHWWHQRLTALALIPLCLLFAVMVVWLVGEPHAVVADWLGSPVPGLLMLVMIVAGLYHLKLGMQVVIEDYVHTEWLKLASIVVVMFGCILLGLACVLAVLSLILGP